MFRPNHLTDYQYLHDLVTDPNDNSKNYDVHCSTTYHATGYGGLTNGKLNKLQNTRLIIFRSYWEDPVQPSKSQLVEWFKSFSPLQKSIVRSTINRWVKRTSYITHIMKNYLGPYSYQSLGNLSTSNWLTTIGSAEFQECLLVSITVLRLEGTVLIHY